MACCRPMAYSPFFTVEITDPARHLATVTLTADLPATPPDGADHLELTMPSWCPGSYLIRDYARLVRDLEVRLDGAQVDAPKIDKATWRVMTRGARRLEVRYVLYAHELTVRTNHIDADHALLHSPAVFLGAQAWRREPHHVALRLPPGWQVSTGLAVVPGSDGHFRAADLDELYDMPIHASAPGTATRATFAVGGVPFELEVWGARAAGGAFSVDDLVRDLGKIAGGHAARMRAVPFDRYVFVLMLTHDGYGGLEHRNSSINLHNTFALTTRKHYDGLLELLSHELFHAWNGKRIAPPALLHFDYTREAYTRCLWVMEGMTSHYDRWNLLTSGVMTPKTFVDKVLDDWTRYVMVPGRRRQSLEASSFDAWIKLYRPDESNLNTTVSYYLKGGLVMLALDLAIRRLSAGARSLDDVLRALWTEYGARGEPHPEDVEPLFVAHAGPAAAAHVAHVFATQIRGTDDPDLAGELAHLGLTLRASSEGDAGARGAWLGVTTTGVKVTGVFDGGPGEDAGLSPGDELLAIDGLRATALDDARALLAARRAGDALDVTLFRRHTLRTTRVTLGAAPASRWEVVVDRPDDAAAARYQAWTGEALPGAGPIATVQTAGRWL
jgi:predicted metalloprotease with PDZ domain